MLEAWTRGQGRRAWRARSQIGCRLRCRQGSKPAPSATPWCCTPAPLGAWSSPCGRSATAGRRSRPSWTSLLAARDEAEGHARARYETAAAVDGDVIRLWFGRLEPATSDPPWRDVLPELPSLPLPPLFEDAGATTRRRSRVLSRATPTRTLVAWQESKQRAAAPVGHARRQADARLPGRPVPRRVGHRPRSPRPAQGAPAGQSAARVVSEVATV